MRASRTYGSVRGAPSNGRSYRDKTTHDNGVAETSVIYETQAQAQSAADNWTHLDEDWAMI